MLRPIESSTREKKSLNGLWRFLPDGPEISKPWTANLPGELECPVPSSYNDLFISPSLRDHIGKVWYQRILHIPRGWVDQRIYIRIDAATHEGEVYINDQLVTKHVGGYTPFEADLTDLVKPGEQVRLTIGVNNVLTHETIPPGEMVTNDVGKVSQKYWHDFFNYAGLARSVWLCSAPKVRVEDITVTTDIEGTSGVVKYEIVTIGSPENVNVDLLDAEAQVVTSATTLTGTLTVKEAKLWQPGAAYLYTFRVRLKSNSELLDEYTLPIGIRTIRVSGLEILINNKPFYFRGFGRHEDMPVKGKGHDDAWMVHDYELMKWCGANSFRTSHYPYAEEDMDYADKHGWVVINETPAVGLNLNITGGITGAAAKRTFCEEFANDKTQESHKQAIRELIQRDKNRPSVIMWSITNEPDSSEEGSLAYFEPLVKLARQLDPTRPLTFANVGMVKPDADRIAHLFDIIGLNRYYGWYVDTGDLESAARYLEAELQVWQKMFQKPLLMLEYGADTVTGLHSIQQAPWSEEYQVSLYEMYHEVFDRVTAVQGEQVWNFADFNTGVGILRVDGNRKGIFTRDRRPKMSAYTLRKRWTGK